MWGLHSPIPTLSDLLASTGTPGGTAKCTDPMFGPMGAMFDWAASLGKYVPRNARIYGTGVGAVYTSSAGDINTDVQVGSLVIPESLVFPGIDITCRLGCRRESSGPVGNVFAKLLHNGGQAVVEMTTALNSEAVSQGFLRYPSYFSAVGHPGSRSNSHGFSTQGIVTFPPNGGFHTLTQTFNSSVSGSIQTLTELYAELSYGG